MVRAACVPLEEALVSGAGVLLMFLFAASCSGTEYATQHFSYPPDSKPHENDWQYTALIIVSSNKRPIVEKTRKNVRIKVYDNSRTILLDEDLEVTAASVRANVVWTQFEELEIELNEVGNRFAEDRYNKNLLRDGPKKLLDLTYKYDSQDRKFNRVN